MTLNDYRQIVSFVEAIENAQNQLCSIRDGKLNNETKQHLTSYVQKLIDQEPSKAKLLNDEEFGKKLIAVYSSILEFLK
jgi:hypothetical protein